MKRKICSAIDMMCSPPQNIKSPYSTQIKQIFYDILRFNNFLISVLKFGILVGHFTASLVATPIALVLHLKGYRFLVVSMRAIGGIVTLDVLIKDDKLHYQTPRNKLMVCPAFPNIANEFAYNLYSKHAVIIYSRLAKVLLMPFFINPFFSVNIDKFFGPENYRSKNIVDGQQWSVLSLRWSEYAEEVGEEPLIQLSNSERRRGEESLAEYLPVGQKFVTLHVRDSGFYTDRNIPRAVKRNADIRNYDLAIKYLTDSGYYVVRMGDEKMVDVSELVSRFGDRFIDYAHSDVRSAFLDCYLISQCEFFIGLASGMTPLSWALGTPTCAVNYFAASNGIGLKTGDITTFKKFYYKNDGTLVPFERLLQVPLCPNPSHEVLDAIGVYQKDNSPEEILLTVREFVERKGLAPTKLQIRAKNLLIPSNFSYGSLGHHSNIILREYFQD